MNPDEKLAAALRQLREDYLADAPRRVAELWTAWARVQNDGLPSLDGLRLLTHRLAGTGGAYGLPDVTERAREADQTSRVLIEAGTPLTPDDLQRLRALVQGIADALQDATTLE